MGLFTATSPDPSSLLSWATLLASLFVGFYLYAKYKQTYWSRRGVYSPPANWLLGHFKDALLLRASPPDVFGRLHKQFEGQEDKPVVGLYMLQKPFLLVRSAEVLKHMLIKDFHVFSDRYFASNRTGDVVGSSGLFSIDNPRWKYLRVKLSPAFTTGKQKKLFSLMLENAENMKNYLSGKMPEVGRETFEVRQVSTKYTTDVISSLTFGIKTDSFAEPEPEFYVRSRSITAQTIGRTFTMFLNFFFPRLNDYFNGSMLAENEDYFRKIFWESMNEREKSGIKRGDFMDLLLELKNEKQSPEFKFEGDQLLAQTAIFFVAGLETSAVTMSFTLMLLSRHPELQKKVRDEIREKIGKGPLTYESISEMTYLQQVVNETLRLYPPAPLLDRVANQDYKIPGTDITIEKGTVIYAALKGLHEDPNYFTDPLVYDPNRFSETRKQDIKSCTYMPFGEGPRICIGMRTGLLQTMVGLITILSEYKISPNSNFKNEVSKRAIFTAPSNGVHVYFERAPVTG